MGLKTGRWSRDEKAFLLANSERLTYAGIAQKLRRKYHSVLYQALKLGLRKKKPWTAEEFKSLREMYPSCEKDEILRKINRTWETIVKMAADLKIRRGALLPPLEKLPHFSLDEKDKVWLACAIDCEAALGLTLFKDGYYCPYISIRNTKKGLLQHFRNLVSCPDKTIRLCDKRYENRKNIYQFDMGRMPQIYAILKEIRPYFIIKGKQADLVMEFIEIHDKLKRANDGRFIYTERQHEIYRELKKLNKKGKN